MYGRVGDDFSGSMIVKDWEGKTISMHLLAQGVITKTIANKKTGSGNTGSTTSLINTCTEEEMCMWYEDCDPYGNCDAPYYDPNNCYPVTTCTGGDEPPCEIYGTCGGGGGGNENPSPPPDPCADAQPAVNAATTLSQNSNYTGAKNSIQVANPNVEHSVTFGTDANGNTTASSMTTCISPSTCTINTSWPGAFADLHNHPNDLPPSPGDMYNLISINNSHSGYNTRMAVTPDGSVFALVVLNLAAANTFKTNYPSVDNGYGPDFPSEIFDKFQEVKNVFMLLGLSSLIAEERAMAYVLDKYNAGIALLKQDSNGFFKRLKTDENTSNGNTTYTANNCQ